MWNINSFACGLGTNRSLPSQLFAVTKNTLLFVLHFECVLLLACIGPKLNFLMQLMCVEGEGNLRNLDFLCPLYTNPTKGNSNLGPAMGGMCVPWIDLDTVRKVGLDISSGPIQHSKFHTKNRITAHVLNKQCISFVNLVNMRSHLSFICMSHYLSAIWLKQFFFKNCLCTLITLLWPHPQMWTMGERELSAHGLQVEHAVKDHMHHQRNVNFAPCWMWAWHVRIDCCYCTCEA